MLISETKIDKNVPDSQFKFDGFNNLYWVHCYEKGGAIMLLFREDLPVKVFSIDKGNESCYVEVILKKTKWLINYSYKPTKNNISQHLESFSQNLGLYASKFENILAIDDLNISMEGINMKIFVRVAIWKIC